MLSNCIIVGVGGCIGAICRYLIGLIPLQESWIFPIKTLCINVAGAFLIGLITALALRHSNLDPHVNLLIKTGFCGGFTTFSTFALESAELFQNGHSLTGVLYIILSTVLCILAVLLAQWLMARAM